MPVNEPLTVCQTDIFFLTTAVNLDKKLATNHFEEGKYGREFEIINMKWSKDNESVNIYFHFVLIHILPISFLDIILSQKWYNLRI